MYRLFMERMAANGIREARISEEWNELEGWEWKTKVSRDVGINPVLNIIYSVSPKHTDEYFAERTRQAASLKVNRLCLKDPGGLLTPERVQTLGADHVRQRRRHSDRTAHPLHHRPRPALLSRSGQARHQDRQHRAAAAGRRLVESVALQRCEKSPRPRLQTADRRRDSQAGVGPFHLHRQARRFSHRRAGGIRLFPIPTPGARRHDFQFALPTAQGRHGEKDRSSAGRNHARARGARLPDHGHAAVAIRRQPGGDQRHRRRALQGSHRSNHSVRARLLGQGRRGTDGPGGQSEDHGSPARQRMGGMATAGADGRRAAQEDECRKRLRRRIFAALES